jgi:hypothetical protein
MKNLFIMVVWAALALGSQVALAGSMICGGTVIEDGQLQPVTEEQVLAACGEPTTRELGQWVYAKPGELVKTLRFDDEGNLMSISVQFEGD